MILLDDTDKSIEVDLDESADPELPIVASFVDITVATMAMSALGSSDTTTNDTTAVTAVAAPGAGVTRKVAALSVYNADDIAHNVTVSLNHGGTIRPLRKALLQPGDTLEYLDGAGWQELVASPIPSGAIQAFGGASAPTGWLLCDGTSLLRASYPALFAAIGTAYGSADGTHFNVPDLRGRLPMGAGTGAGLNASGTGAPTGTALTARTLGAWLGEETHLLSGAESGTSVHSHVASVTQSYTTGNSGGVQPYYLNYTGTTTGLPNSVTVSNSSAADAANRHATIPPVVVCNFVIKT